MKTFVVGIDAGGTSVRLRWKESASGIEEQVRLPAAPDGGPEPALELLRQVPGEVLALTAGITKVSRGDTKAAWEQTLRTACPTAAVNVVPDFVVAFHGAVPEGVGLLCVAGTGSVIYGESGRGESVRVGGRGWEYGDEGSGASVTAELMRRTLRACDGLWPHTPLTRAVCATLETDDAALVGERGRQRALSFGRGFLVQLVAASAQNGDDEAKGLFTGAAGWLARYVRAAHAQLDFAGGEVVRVVCVGGMWELGDWMHPPFELLMARWLPGVITTAPRGTPCEGALRLAERSVL
ncbi:N-acetylglucosamine kinase [Armatimonas sp.]|uniref:N-acetylglucosamine kinase n=1 Tax=Armatimonas sp. TaxID=1872638 RepID=UPI0037517630